jgi:hypothetical protein
MTATAEAPPAPREAPLFEDEVTLEDVVLAGLRDGTCLVCGGATDDAGRCAGCGSELS